MNHVIMGMSLFIYFLKFHLLHSNFINNYKICIQNKNSQIKGNIKQYIKIVCLVTVLPPSQQLWSCRDGQFT